MDPPRPQRGGQLFTNSSLLDWKAVASVLPHFERVPFTSPRLRSSGRPRVALLLAFWHALDEICRPLVQEHRVERRNEPHRYSLWHTVIGYATTGKVFIFLELFTKSPLGGPRLLTTGQRCYAQTRTPLAENRGA
jgi:hypothetical protein